MADLFADIIIDISLEKLDRTFQYAVPDELRDRISVGSRVVVPFGNGNRTLAGFVLELSDQPKIDRNHIKNIIEITNDDTLVEQKLLSLAYWMKSQYGSTMNRALGTVLPIKKSVKNSLKKTVVLKLSQQEALEKAEEYEKKHRLARARLLLELTRENVIDYKLVTGKLNISSSIIKSMCEKGEVAIESERLYRNTVSDVGRSEKVPLLEAQKEIVDDFLDEYNNDKRGVYLICGVTGSGKTEVYMEMIDAVVKSGKSVIVLIPEIALTYQTVMRFYKRFGDRVSTLHSKLSDGEKYDQFERAKKHEIDIMIGPRSALFTPFDNLGLIVIDEEHETSYKSDQMPKYHAREVAIRLAKMHKASVVLGSATPDVTSYFKAKNGEYKLYTLSQRAKGAVMPEVDIVDLREELARGNKSIFSEKLQKAIGERILKNEQVILFLNRRGYAGFVSCRSCGEVVKCPHCDVSLTSHYDGRLVCHYCGFERTKITECPKCKSRLIGGMRAGTEAVEEQIKQVFPQARVLRMDKDTTKSKNDYEEILSAFANREADILVGTQMIVKGHDFPYVTLVGILAADMSLNGSDYRAAERTYQLIVQAAGRAGRADRPGNVIIQTYQKEHYAINAAARQNYTEFYEEEMGYRALMSYPPAGHMLAVLVESQTEEMGHNFATSLAASIKDGIIKNGVVIGPAAATVKKISDIYRFMIYVKSKDLGLLIEVKNSIERFEEKAGNKSVRVVIDLDPMNGY